MPDEPTRPFHCARSEASAAPMAELAHLVREAVLAGLLGRRLPLRLTRPDEELAEAAVFLEVPPHHHRVIRFERLRDAVHQGPRKSQRVAHFTYGRPGAVRDEV